jgi:hypothetical protein
LSNFIGVVELFDSNQQNLTGFSSIVIAANFYHFIGAPVAFAANIDV